MNWWEVALVGVDGEAAEAVAQVMSEYGQGSAVIESVLATTDSAGWVEHPLVVKCYIADDPDAPGKIDALKRALWHLHVIYPMPEPQVKMLEEADWANAWKQHYTRLKPGNRLVIVPAWDEEPMGEGELPVRLDPGMAFGTGTHPTTQLSLMLMEKYLNPGDAVFDVGAGSGVLSIGAVRLNAGTVVACDLDPVAVAATKENAERNGMLDAIEMVLGSIESFPGPFDTILMNILAEIIVKLLPDTVTRLKPDGTLLLSGIITEREAIINDALAENNLTIVERLIIGDWLGLAVKHTERGTQGAENSNE
jgi:ribosomal protein L11 methyltransferase